MRPHESTPEGDAKSVASAVEQHVRRRGLGSPKEFHCPECRSRVVKPTGERRPYTPQTGHALGTRGNLVAAEYLCECGHTGWTNHNDLIKEPGKMSKARIYFYDSDRPKGAKELRENDANGGQFLGFVDNVEGIAQAVTIEGPQGPRTIDRACFPEATGTVRGKLWLPGVEAEWVTLASAPASDGVRKLTADEVKEIGALEADGPTDPAMERVERGKRIAEIVVELKQLGIIEELLDPIRKEYEAF